ncbi:MAG: pyridoxamine 5'-phosphate oxidase family protein [Hespellia sp.]|nr:pyridoxamine 5'-phosphate oxidase family protein [Hespellia sp.]
MRRRDREIESREEFLHVLDTCESMCVGMHDGDGIYMIPMNYGYTWEEDQLVFYIHGAVEGKKLDLIRENADVAFELNCDNELIEGRLPCQYGYRYSCITGKGRAEVVQDPQEKMKGLTVLMKCLTGKEFEFNERLVSIVEVIKITAEEFSGKRRE